MEATPANYNQFGDLVDPNNKGKLQSGNCFSHLFLFFNYKVMKLGNQKSFSQEDCWEMHDRQLYGVNWARFEKLLEKKPLSKNSLFSIILSYILKSWMTSVFFIILSNILVISLPFFLRGSIDWVVAYKAGASGTETWKIIVFIVGLFFVLSMRGFFGQHGQTIQGNILAIVSTTIYGLVFEKLKSIDLRAMSTVNVGTLSNNITNDMFRVTVSVFIAHYIVLAPVIILVYLFILIFTIKYYALAGLGIIVLVMFLQVFLSLFTARINATKLRVNSQRNQEINFSVKGIKSVKFNAWEDVSKKIIHDIRQKEKSIILKLQLVNSFSKVLNGFSPALASFACIALYNTYEQTLDLGTIFFIITIFNNLASPLGMFFFGLSNFVQCLISLKRISTLLVLPDETSESGMGGNGAPNGAGSALDLAKGTVEFRDASFAYATKEYEDNIKNLYEKFKLTDLDKRGKKKIAETKKAENPNKFNTIIKNINLTVNPGEIVMVIGNVGSGKTTLLKSLLKLLHTKSGSFRSNGQIGYIPQESFLINNTVRENIIFGHEFDKKRYYRTIRLCQLEPDLKTLPGGEYAEIGEKGLNLSGGQKQRISIARALYADTDIVLIDDALSALDSHVGARIFEDVILEKFVNQGKTVIMTTHLLGFLDRADRVVFMKDGVIRAEGKLEQIRDSSEDIQRFMDQVRDNQKILEHAVDDLEDEPNLDTLPEHDNAMFEYSSAVFDEVTDHSFLAEIASDRNIGDLNMSKDIEKMRKQKLRSFHESKSQRNIPIQPSLFAKKSNRSIHLTELGNSTHSKREMTEAEILIIQKGTETEEQKRMKMLGTLTKKERQEKGKIKRKVFTKYFKAGTWCFFIFCQILIILTMVSFIAIDFWVSAWSQNNFKLTENWYIIGYGLFILGSFVLGIFRSFLWAVYAVKASMKIFKDLLNNIMKKPMSYFDTTPIGQILSLMGKDTDMVDQAIPNMGLNVFIMSYQIIAIAILASLANIIMLPLFVIILGVMFYFMNLYLNVQRELKRIELKSNSPILSNIIELYSGLVIFKNYNKVSYIRKTYQNNVNRLVRSLLHARYSNAFMQLFTELAIAFLISITFMLITLGVVYSWPFIPDNSALLSVTMNWVMRIPSFINFYLFAYAFFIKSMGSVERIFFNVDYQIKEGSVEFPTPKASKSYPANGEIEIKNICVRYRDNLPLVLKNLSFTVKDKEKVGIVGRTGSGKSSLLLALTRILNVVNSKEYPTLQYEQKIGPYKDIDKKKVKAPGKGSGAVNSVGLTTGQNSKKNNGSYFNFNSENKLLE